MILQKMNRKGFTLVELIVVITILAILGTIAFLSFQGYSASARDAKRSQDLQSIQSKISVMQTSGTPLLSFASGTTYNELTTATASGIAGLTGAVFDTTKGYYIAGDVNYTVLGLKQSDFQDSKSNVPYKIGATTLDGGTFELAATMEGDSVASAKVIGNYTPRAALTITASKSNTTNKSFTISSADIGKFKVGDTLVGTGAVAGKIIKISADGTTITTDGTIGNGDVTLASEVAGLIGSGATAGSAVAVTDGQSTILPY